MIAGKISCATVEDLHEANKTLRFAKSAKGIALKLPSAIGTDYGF